MDRLAWMEKLGQSAFSAYLSWLCQQARAKLGLSDEEDQAPFPPRLWTSQEFEETIGFVRTSCGDCCKIRRHKFVVNLQMRDFAPPLFHLLHLRLDEYENGQMIDLEWDEQIVCVTADPAEAADFILRAEHFRPPVYFEEAA